MWHMSHTSYSPKEYRAIYNSCNYSLVSTLKKSNTLYSVTGFTGIKLGYDTLFTNK